MRKSELENIPVEIIEINDYIKNIEADIKYLISAKTVTDSKKSKTLVVTFFNKENLELKYRAFINKRSKEYLTLSFDEVNKKHWHTGILSNVIHYDWIDLSLVIDTTTITCILKYFNVEDNPLKAVADFQNDILEQKALKRYEKKIDYINSYMKTVPSIPKTFKKWVDETALLHSRYIFYKYKKTKKAIKGFCTHCKTEVDIINPKHNMHGICPNCKSSITFKSEGKSHKLTDTANCCLIQKTIGKNNNIIIRFFEVQKIYGYDYRNPALYLYEAIRDFYCSGIVKEFEAERYDNNTWRKDIKQGLFGHNYNFFNISLYSKNLSRVLKNTPYEYSQIKEYATQRIGYKFPVYQYLYMYENFPFIEYFWKMGLTELVKDMIDPCVSKYTLRDAFNLDGKSFFDILKIEKNLLPRIKKLNVSLEELKVFQLNGSVSNEQLNFLTSSIKEYNFKTFFEISNLSSFSKTQKYILKQSELTKNAHEQFSKTANKTTDVSMYIQNILIDWYDYIKKCQDLKYDLKNEFVLFPKNLKKRHDEICIEFDIEKMNIYNEKIGERYKKLSKLYNWQYKDYFIVVADSADALIKEGQSLHHCVGGSYKRKMANGETIILFLRKRDEPDKSFYTIEISDYTILQIRGLGNCSVKPEINSVLDRFKKDKLVPEKFMSKAV